MRATPTAEADLSDLMTRAYVADDLDVSIRTVDNLIATGELGVVRIGRSVRVPRSELRRFKRERFTPPAA